MVHRNNHLFQNLETKIVFITLVSSDDIKPFTITDILASSFFSKHIINVYTFMIT